MLPIRFGVLGRYCGFPICTEFLLTVECKTLITVSHKKLSAGMPSMRKPASSETNPAPVLL